MSFTLPRPINQADEVAEFDSGEPSLNDYLHRRALANHIEGASRCFVSTKTGRVVGYYSLAAGSVVRRQAPGSIRRNMPEPVPVILLSRLAVDRKEQGSGLGKHLLRDAISRSVIAADSVGVRAILVHAIHEEAAQFYLYHEFVPSPTDDMHLMLPMKDARALLGKQDD